MTEETKTEITSYKRPAFPLGRLLTSRGARDAIGSREIAEALARHHGKDWGDCCPADWALNDRAVVEGSRIFSAYHSSTGVKFWIITEADREATSVLLPDEY
ncbi:MAG TPA: type I restriction endonuclease subunit M [Pirellulales bacterium]|jgi:hypothetical protein|nr:type I restriction endonuclease subunit M [Pirellulales bacterium]